MPAVDELLDLILRDVLDVGFAGIEHGHFVRVGIKSRDFVPRFGKSQRQQQAYIAAADDGYLQLGAFEKFRFPVDRHESRSTPSRYGLPSDRSQQIGTFGDP